MKVFVVNLDHDVEKLAKVSERLRNIGVEFERIPAVSGRALPTEEKTLAKNRFRLWCSIGRPLQDGELGCALSHLNIYRKMLAEGIQNALVLEDDVLFDDRLPEQMRRVEPFMSSGVPRVVLLSDRSHAAVEEWVVKPAKKDFGTFAYAINIPAAQAILKSNYPVCRPCDHWHYWRGCGLIELYHAYPTVCDYDHSSESGTAPGFKVSDLPMHRWILHKSLRLIGKTLDALLPA